MTQNLHSSAVIVEAPTNIDPAPILESAAYGTITETSSIRSGSPHLLS